MSISADKFRGICNDILKQPEAPPGEASEIIEFINDTFKALGALNTDRPKQITFHGEQLNVSTLKDEDLRIFAECAKKFFKNNAVQEDKAGELLQNLNNCLANPQVKGSVLVINDIKKAKEQLLINEDIASLPKGGKGEKITSEVAERLTSELKTEQGDALQFEKKQKKAEKTLYRHTMGGVALAAVGSGCIGFGIGLSFIVLPVGIVLTIIGVLTIIPAIRFLVISPTEGRNLTQSRKDYLESVKKLENLDALKRACNEPEFIAFAEREKYGFDKIKNDTDALVKFLELFKLEKQYAELLPKVEQQGISLRQASSEGLEEVIKDSSDLAANALQLTEFLKKVNSIRIELNLEPLTPPKV